MACHDKKKLMLSRLTKRTFGEERVKRDASTNYASFIHIMDHSALFSEVVFEENFGKMIGRVEDLILVMHGYYKIPYSICIRPLYVCICDCCQCMLKLYILY